MSDNKYSLHVNENILRARVDKEYLGELIIHNNNLIWFTIRNYVGNPDRLAEINGMEKEDIYQVGCMGFINAINNFDCGRGTLFTTYVPTVIAGEVKGYLRDKGRLIKLPRATYELNKKIFKYMEDVHYSKCIPFEEIAAGMCEDVDEVQKALTVGDVPIAISISGKNKFAVPVFDITENMSYALKDSTLNILETTVVDEIYQEQLLTQIGSYLSERDIRILYAKLEGKTHEQIAYQESISKITVTRTMNKIRKIVKDVLED